jgi:hypothetical protein
VRGEITAVGAKEREEDDLVCKGILTVETSNAAHKRLISLFLGCPGEVGMCLPGPIVTAQAIYPNCLGAQPAYMRLV